MKFKVRLQELEKQDSKKEVLNEWIDDAFKALVKLGSGGTMLKAAGRVIRAGIPLSAKAGDAVSAAINLLPQKLAKEIAEAAIGAANKAAEAGEAVVFQVRVAMGGDGNPIFMAFSVGPDGIQSVRTFAGVAGRRGELAALGREADKVIKGTSDVAAGGARAGDDVVDAGEEAAEAGARSGDDAAEAGEEAAGGATRATDSSKVTDELLDNLRNQMELRFALDGVNPAYIDEAREFGEAALQRLTASKVWNEGNTPFWEATLDIVSQIADGKLVVKNADEVKAIFNSRAYDILDDAREAGKVVPGEATKIPLIDDTGRVVITSDGRPIKINVSKTGEVAMMTGRAIRATELAPELAKLVDEFEEIMGNLDTLPALIKRYLIDPGVSFRGVFTSGQYKQAMKFFREAVASLWRKVWDDVKVWHMPFKAAGKDVGKVRAFFISLDMLLGAGVVKTVFGAVGGLGRWLGILTKTSPGLKGTRTLARTALVVQVAGIVTMAWLAYAYRRDEVVKDVEATYKAALASPDPVDKLSFILEVNNNLKDNNQRTINVDPNAPLDLLDRKVKEAHEAYYDFHTKDSWFVTNLAMPASKGAAGLTMPYIHSNLLDWADAPIENWQKKASLDPEVRNAVEKDEEEAEKTSYEFSREMEDAVAEKLRKLAPWNPLKARKEAEQMVGERKPEAGAEIEPDPDVDQQVPKPDQPGETIGAPRKAAQAADATDIGDFEGLDDTLFEIFNVDKPISIKVKSSSPRLRAKITEKK